MSHMVIYRTNSGKPGFHQAETINEAIAYVERLRNAEGVETARIYRLEQVDFSFEPVYKVRVDDAEFSGHGNPGQPAMPSASGPPVPSVSPSMDQGPPQPNPVPDRDPIRLEDEPPIADMMGTIPGSPPPVQQTPAGPRDPRPVADPVGPPFPAAAEGDDDGETRRGLFGR